MKKRWKSLLALALPYVIIVSLPIISILFLGNTVLNNYQEKIISERQRSIESAHERFLQKINKVETVTKVIASTDMVKSYAYAGINKSEQSILDCIEIRDLFKNFLINSEVSVIYYYDKNNDRIISSKSIMRKAVDYFFYFYKLNNYTAEESVERLRDFSWGVEYSSCLDVKLGKTDMQVIEYRTSIPFDQTKNIQGQMVFVMDVENIFSDFFDIVEAGGEFYVYDNKDRLIYGSGEQYEEVMELSDDAELKLVYQGDEKIYGMVCHSAGEQWKVKVYLSDISSAGSTIPIMPYVWLLVVVPVTGSIVLCIYFTQKNHKEIKEVLSLFKNQSEPGKEEEVEIGYKIIREYADKIVSENIQFRERIISSEYARKYEIFDKLVRNIYENKEQMIEELSNTDLNIREGRCVVLCIHYEDSYYRIPISEDITIKDFVKELLNEIMERQFELFDTSARETICVLYLDNNEDMEIVMRNIISSLNVEIAYYYGIDVKFAAGNTVNSIYRLSESYVQAKDVIKYNETSGNRLCLYSELERLKDVYYYPREFEEKIYNYVVVGKVDEAKKIIESIYRENFEKNKKMLSVRAIEMMKNRLRENVVSIAEKYDISVDSVVLQLNDEQNIRHCFDIIYEFIDRIVREIGNKRKTAQNHSVSKIMDYVSENYCDNTISLKQISLKFGFHENYISNLFKNAYGENLSAVIERLRIEKACDMIKNTSMKIGDIAEAVGYTSDASFRRAFKKITGVSPGEYRET